MIEAGEYVRTKKGKIFKYGKGRAYLGKDNEIVKHSKIISEVVEVGDYVNGYKVITVDTDAPNNCKECIELDRNNAYEYQWISRNEIKTILTKELYQANCYTVERKEE